MMNMVKTLLKRSFNMIGLDVVRLSKSPRYSLLGLRQLPIKTIIDVGANRGQFAGMIMDIFPGAHVYAFEPLPEAFRQLKEWADKNKQVTVYNLALGEAGGVKEMLRHVDHSPSSSILKTTKRCEELYPFTKAQEAIPVQAITLDNWFDGQTIPAGDILVKLDVQGYEDRIIAGGRRTLGMASACIAEISLDRLYEYQSDFKDIVSALYELGYRYNGNLNQSYGEDGHVIFIDAIFIKHR